MRRASAAVAVALMGLASVIGLDGVAAADPLPSNCSSDGTRVTCTYNPTGGEQTFTVPAGVTAVDVVAIGAGGAIGTSDIDAPMPGRGARASGTLTNLAAGQVLYVEVGGTPTGGGCYVNIQCVGGFNGGGSSTRFAGGGGGASDVRLATRGDGGSLSTRKVVGAGGGGQGSGQRCSPTDRADQPGGSGGDAGASGGENAACGPERGTGGGAGTASDGGAGGTPRGQAGSLGQGGGDGGSLTGGGGGGGLYGGGGGGAGGINDSNDYPQPTPSGGGGGGSSLVPAGGSVAVTGDPASVTISYLVPDTTPPVVTASVSGTAGDSGYYRSDVQVSWTVSDPESRVTSTSGCGPVTVSQDTTGQTITCSATSNGGTTTQSVTVKRDATAPTVVVNGGPADGATYTAGSVPAAPTCQASDATSGVRSCMVSGYSTAPGPHQESITATDNTGNQTTVTRSYTVTTDFTAPVSSASAGPGPIPSNQKPVTVVVSATVKSSSGATVGSFSALCWNSRGTVLTINASDSGSGVASETYAATGAQPIASTTVAAAQLPVKVTIDKAGLTTVSYAAKDNAGNQEATRKQVVLVNTSAPFTCTGPAPAATLPAHGSVTWTTTVNGKTSTATFTY